MSLLAEIQALIQPEAAQQAFLQRMQAAVRPEDFERIVALEQLLVRAHEALLQNQQSSAKLRRVLFGPKTQKTRQLFPPAEPPPAEPKPKRRGHGRRGSQRIYRSSQGSGVPSGLTGRFKQPMERPARDSSWYYLDNGFSSADAMNVSHNPIVSLARRELSGLTGNVLDLNCGNGVLLAKVCEGQTGLTLYGVDTNQAALEHAGEVLPLFAAHFTVGDIFNAEIWGSGIRYALTLLMAGRLTEVDRLVAELNTP